MWPTPTPIPTSAFQPTIPGLDPSQFTTTFTDWILQGWHWFDTNPVATFVWFIMLALIIFAGVMSIRRHLENL